MNRVRGFLTVLLSGICILSCKEKGIKNFVKSSDSALTTRKVTRVPVAPKTDSLSGNILTETDSLQTEEQPEVPEGIIRILQAKSLPLSVKEKFTDKHQSLTIKLEHYQKPVISVRVIPEHKDFNIRINQIRTAKGNWDGPFGQEVQKYPTPGSGQVWIVIGKDLMADGQTTGSFEVKIE